MATRHGTSGNDWIDASSDSESTAFLDYGIGQDHVTGTRFNDTFFLSVDANSDTILGGDGEDRIDYTAADRGVQIDLHGTVRALFDGHLTSVAGLASIEDATGTRFDDSILGNAGNNMLDGGFGNDVIDGGGGTNTLSLLSWNQQTTFQKILQQASISLGFGDQDGSADRSVLSFTDPLHRFQTVEHDTLRNIQNVIGSDLNETITGNVQSNHIDGGAGNDTIDGGLGSDVLDGGSGSNTVSFISHDIALPFIDEEFVIDLGHPGDDGGAEINGRLAAGAPLQILEQDQLKNFQNVIGSSHAELISGSELDNRIDGRGGDDVMNGFQGNDTLMGGDGNDRLIGGPGADILTGGKDADKFVFLQVADSPNSPGQFDTITDFQSGIDKIDLHAIDASPDGGFQHLVFDAVHSNTTAVVPPVAGNIEAWYDSQRDVTVLMAETGPETALPFAVGDTHPSTELYIEMTGHVQLSASDFIL
jgi:Ca2+-binding RTX toxin-like protein